jgi:RAD51-like protein 3
MRLSNLIPSIPADLVTCLGAIDIRTETDLLFSAPTFDIFRRLPRGTISLQELIDYTDVVAELCAAPSISGYDLLSLENESQRNAVELTSGNQELDDFLVGLSGGHVIEISGDRGTGKSARFSIVSLFSVYVNHVVILRT